MLALKSFKDLITFSTWNGLITARQKAGPLGPARTLPKQIVTNRMREVNVVKQSFTENLIAAYRAWSKATDYTWKDQYTGRALSLAHTAGQFPIVVTDISISVLGDVVTLSFTFSNYVIIEGTGYGFLAWGESPWGHSSAFSAPEGAPLNIDYVVNYTHPLPYPSAATDSSTSPRIPCVKPPDPEVFDTFPADDVPATWTGVLRTILTGYTRKGITGWAANCALAFTECWDAWFNTPTLTYDNPSNALISITNGSGGFGWNYYIFSKRAHLGFNMTTDFDETKWRLVDDLKFILSWSGSNDLEPWKPIATFNGETKILTYADPDVHFSVPAWDTVFALTTDTNDLEPPSGCPLTPLSWLSAASGFHMLQVHTIAHPSQDTWSGTLPTVQEAEAQITQLPGFPPVLCPPVPLQ